MENNILLFAAILCGICAFLSLLGHTTQIKRSIVLLWCLSTLFVIIAAIRFITYLVVSNFEYSYVYYHSSLDTSLVYKISALWSGQEGSFLLWSLLLQIMGFFVIMIQAEWSCKSFGIYSLINSCITFMCYITKPFAKLDTVPLDGEGLNAALKNPWMILHPPMVFIAYSALAVLFSLLPASKALHHTASKYITRWLYLSWWFLGIGIISGSIWAYLALGWGGYWAWDPIENAALIPWLLLCAFLHNQNYNPKFVCSIPFATASFGVFLARSGILKNLSTHAYANGSLIISILLLLFLSGILIFLVISILRKKNTVKNCFSVNKIKNKVIIYSLYGYAVFILIGTIAPIIFPFETPISYYNILSIIFALLYVFMLLWIDWEWLKKRNILMLAVSTLLLIGYILLFKAVKIRWLMLLWICLMPLSLWFVNCFWRKRIVYYFFHLGVLLLIIGAITSSALGKESISIVNDSASDVSIEGNNLSAEKLSTNNMLILSTPTQDILINPSDITRSSGKLLIPYTTKPFISVFWLGCFVIISNPVIIICLKKLSSSKYKPFLLSRSLEK